MIMPMMMMTTFCEFELLTSKVSVLSIVFSVIHQKPQSICIALFLNVITEQKLFFENKQSKTILIAGWLLKL